MNIPYDNQPGVYETEVIKPDEIYAAEMQSQRVANVIAQTSPDNQLLEIEWRIRGYRKDNMNGTWVKIESKVPEPSSLLVSRYISYLGSLLNDNTRFTNLASSEINSIMKLCIEYLTDDMDANARIYGLENEYTERTRIGHIILATTFMVLKRSQNGMESRRVWNAINMNVAESTGQENKKGFLDAFKFWKQ